jgi:hypothetical protein
LRHLAADLAVPAGTMRLRRSIITAAATGATLLRRRIMAITMVTTTRD